MVLGEKKEAINIIEDTVSEQDEEFAAGCSDSVKVSSKPSRLNFGGESIQMKKQTSLTPVHQAQKSFVAQAEEQDKQLIIEIDNTDEEAVSQANSSAPKESNSVQSSSVQAFEFVKTPKVQSLIRQIVQLKSGRNQQKR